MKTILLFLLPFTLFSSVVTAPVTRGDLIQSQTFNGTLHFNEHSRIASQSAGLVEHLYFDEGDFVKKGALLVDLDSDIIEATITSLQASIKETEFSYKKAKLDLQRYDKLLKKESISQQKYDEFYFAKMELEQKLLSLKANLKAQEIQKKRKKIYAPYSGQITLRSISIGEWVQQGGAIASLVNTQKVDLHFSLPSSYINTIIQKKFTVTINNKKYEATHLATILSGDTKLRTFPLKLRLQKSKDLFYDGMPVELELPKSAVEDALLVPRDAVIKRFGQDVIFIVEDNKAVMIPVKVIGFKDSDAAIRADKLKSGDSVIIKGNERIFPNQEIK